MDEHSCYKLVQRKVSGERGHQGSHVWPAAAMVKSTLCPTLFELSWLRTLVSRFADIHYSYYLECSRIPTFLHMGHLLVHMKPLLCVTNHTFSQMKENPLQEVRQCEVSQMLVVGLWKWLGDDSVGKILAIQS